MSLHPVSLNDQKQFESRHLETQNPFLQKGFRGERMDSMGAIAEGEWSSLSGMYTTEEVDFMSQLLGNCPLPDELAGSSNWGIPSAFWPDHHSTINMTGASYCSSDSNSFSQGSCYSAGSSILFSSSSQESNNLQSDSQISHPVFLACNGTVTMDLCMEEVTNTSSYLLEGDDCLNQEMCNGNVGQARKTHQDHALPNENSEPKMESEMPQAEPMTEKKRNLISENSKRRSRSSGDVQKNRRNARLKKNQSGVFVSTTNNYEDGNAGLNGQSSASCSSEDDSNPSEEFNGVISSSKGEAAMNLNGKTRASKGAATDPQSLYARKRRERINERLRILQNLVPNGTKVDISTMLEEAVQYVKFLQLQIKLLSSDDLWMYAPIAYNGMDIGLDLKVATPKRS